MPSTGAWATLLGFGLMTLAAYTVIASECSCATAARKQYPCTALHINFCMALAPPHIGES